MAGVFCCSKSQSLLSFDVDEGYYARTQRDDTSTGTGSDPGDHHPKLQHNLKPTTPSRRHYQLC